MKALTHQNPSHVSPPLAVQGCMRVAVFIGELMMNAVSCYPEDRPTFKRQSSAESEPVFNPLRRFISAMREQPMIAHSDSQATGDPPEHHRGDERLPG